MATDWRDNLMALLPDLPPGNDVPVSAPEPDDKPAQGRLDISVDRKGRGGKVATIISGFCIDDSEVANIAARIKKRLGVGGSARGGEILIQGNHAHDVKTLLTEFNLKSRII